MIRERWSGLLWLLLCSAIFIVFGSDLERTSPDGMANFKAVYYGARCLLQHSDPYNEGEFLRVYQADGGAFPLDPKLYGSFRRSVLLCVNLPTSLFLVAPLAILAWVPAHLLWMILIVGSLVFSALLIWNLAGDYAQGVSLFLTCILLANGEILLSGGNLAGIAVSLCVVAVWCFLQEKFALAGVLCFAVSLALKPHDTGLVWLYFLLAGGVYRKRALQTLALTAMLSLPAILWVSHVAPNWMQELNSNLLATSAHGDISDPGPTSISVRSSPLIIDLQTIISVFRDDPRVYNPVTYLICGALLVAWSLNTLRGRPSPKRDWLALAAIVPLTMLVTYHRSYDAKLMLLTVPACAMLWAQGGRTRWVALCVTTVGVVLTSDIPLAMFLRVTKNLQTTTTGWSGKLLTVALARPVPLALLATSVFYLWVYVRSAPGREEAMASRGPA